MPGRSRCLCWKRGQGVGVTVPLQPQLKLWESPATSGRRGMRRGFVSGGAFGTFCDATTVSCVCVQCCTMLFGGFLDMVSSRYFDGRHWKYLPAHQRIVGVQHLIFKIISQGRTSFFNKWRNLRTWTLRTLSRGMLPCDGR